MANAISEYLAKNGREADIEEFNERLTKMLGLCESTIEKHMLAGLMVVFDLLQSRKTHFMKEPFSFQSLGDSGPGVFICCQGRVKQYRADFLLRVVAPGVDRYMVIECDGHDYHERTKEQAKRDRSRDRFMAALGIVVLRFTGQELIQDPEPCAWEVDAVIGQMLGQPIV